MFNSRYLWDLATLLLCIPLFQGCRHSEAVVVKVPESLVFGKQAWEKYIGDVGPEPPLPANIDSTLNNACPFWPGRKVRDTHLLTLIPARVGAQNFSLDLLGELIKQKFPDNKKGYRMYTDPVQHQFGNESPPESYWVLMTREVIPFNSKSGKGNYKEKEKLVARYEGYALPSALEAATSILGHYVCRGERLFSNGSRYLYTYCLELTDDKIGGKNPVSVGNFSPDGLCVQDDSGAFMNYCTGMACSRRL